LARILLVAPTSGSQRVAEIARRTSGFLYVVSQLGTTGRALQADAALQRQLALARRVAAEPVAVGFGVSRPEQVRALAPLVDGVIVGSALVRRAPKGPDALAALVAELGAALR